MTVSAIYEGEVRHDRLTPRRHAFRQRLYLMFLDLEELPELFRGRLFWSAKGWNLSSFRRSDYLGDPERPLREAVLERVEAELGRRPEGPVRILTQLRTFGYVFNPVTFYYCHEASGELGAVVAEITNTPWRERHAYVLDVRQAARRAGALRWSFDKDFHVSPFFDMDQIYDWAFREPGEQVTVDMTNQERGRPVFHASFHGTRKPLSTWNLARVLMRYPLMPLRAHLAIYWHAALLWMKRTPFFTHPDKRQELSDANTA